MANHTLTINFILAQNFFFFFFNHWAKDMREKLILKWQKKKVVSWDNETCYFLC